MMAAQTLRAKWHAFAYYAGSQSIPRALFRWGIWGIRCILSRPTTVRIPRFGMDLYLAPRWKGCWKAIFVFRERFFEVSDPELEFVHQTLKLGGVFVDAGAYHGWYALVASGVVGKGGLVIAFEPNPDAYRVLAHNIAVNGRWNIKAFNLALADTDGRVWLYKGPGDGAASALARTRGGEGREQVEVRRLDSILEELDLRQVDVMKIDVQGAEARLLRGAMETLRSWRPIIVFEVDPVAARDMGVPEREAWDVLAGLGYRFFRLSPTGPVRLTEFPTLQEGTFLNVLAVPVTETA